MKLVIPGKLPTLNEYIQKERSNKFLGAKVKREATELVMLVARAKRPKTPYKRVKVEFVWYVKNSRKDPDNIAFAKKFILDGLVHAGVIENDTWANIVGFSDTWFIDANERTEVLIYDES